MSEAGESNRLRSFRAATQKFIDAFNEGDYERAFSSVSEDFEQVFPPGFVQDRLAGRRAAIEFFEEFQDDVGVWQLKATEHLEIGPSTFVFGYETTGVGQTSGIAGGWHEWDVIEVDDQGLTRHVRQFWDRDEAMRVARDAAGAPQREEKPA